MHGGRRELQRARGTHGHRAVELMPVHQPLWVLKSCGTAVHCSVSQCARPWIRQEHASLAGVASRKMSQVLKLSLQLLDLSLAFENDLCLVCGGRWLAGIAR